jgi:hypothetical protein
MWRLSKDKTKVLDYDNRIVGFIIDGRFTQYKCDKFYRVGLTPMELEKISEIMQRDGVGLSARCRA